MRKPVWTSLDFGLVLTGIGVAVALPVIREVWIGPSLAEALVPLQELDARLPRLVMLGAFGYTAWIGLAVVLVLVIAGSLVRTKASAVAGRLLLALPLVVAPAAAALDGYSVPLARSLDPADFGIAGITRCRCPESLLVSPPAACGCNDERQVVVVLLDKDHDRKLDTRCRSSRPSATLDSGTLQCEPAGTYPGPRK